MSINEYLKRYIIVGSILTIVVSVLFSLGFPNTTSTPLIIAPILFTVVSIGTLKLLAMPALSAVLKFSNAFMLTNVGKILVYLVYFIISYVDMEKERRMTFVAVFMVLYLFFLVFDTITLLKFFKDNNQLNK